MNGSNTVWDDGTSSLQTIVWDDYAKLSNPGGANVEGKIGFISEDETQTFTLAALGLTSFDPTTFDTLGVRATSVNGDGTIKWADTTPDTDQGPGETLGRIVYSVSGAANDLDVFAFTYDASASLPGGIAQITNTPYDESLSDLSEFASPSSLSPLPQAPVLTGTFQVVNAGAGDQTDPHVDVNIASYRSVDADLGLTEIRYFDFATNTDHVVPTGIAPTLSDVSDGRIVYSEQTVFGSQIGVYDTNTDGTFIIPGGTFRVDPSIGSTTVAFEDRSFSANPLESEIVVYDLATNTTTRLTNDALRDVDPEVSEDGNAVVFQKTDLSGVNSDVYLSVQTFPGVWSTTNISATLPTNGEEVSPSVSNGGQFVTWSSNADGDFDIYVWDRDTNTTHQFDLPGVQRNPSISEDGKHIAFESNETGAQYDIYVAENPLHDDFIM